MSPRSNTPERRAHSPSSDSNNTNKWRRSGTAWWQAVLLCATISILLSAVAFTVGTVKFFDSSGPKSSPPALIQDTTFFILLAQAIPNVVNGIIEVVKIHFSENPRWRSHALLLAILAIGSILSVAAPIVYGVANRRHTWTQVQTMILHFCASFLTIICGMISVFAAGRAKDERIHDIELGDRDHNASQYLERIRILENEIGIVKADNQELKKKYDRKSQAVRVLFGRRSAT